MESTEILEISIFGLYLLINAIKRCCKKSMNIPLSEEENEEKLRKMGENNRRMRKTEEMLLSCPPKVESLATPGHRHLGTRTQQSYIFVKEGYVLRWIFLPEHKKGMGLF